MWDTKIQKAEVTELSDIVVEFKYRGNKRIDRVNKSCGCTAYKWLDPHTLQLTIETGLVRNNVHPNLYEQGKEFYLKYATVDIIYNDNSKLYNRDNSKDKEISSKEMSCIFFMCEPDPDKNKFYRIPEQERLQMLKDIFYPDFDDADEDIKRCIEEYPFLNLSAVKRALKEEIDSMRKRASFIANFEYEGKSISDIKNFDMVRKATPQILEAYEKIEDKFLKEKTSSRIRGGRRKSKAEEKLL